MPFGSKGLRLQNRDLRSKFKDAMAIDYVRGGNPRCPSLLVGGLMLVLLFFACSWWSLTSQNFELLSQIENLQEKFRLSAEILEKSHEAQKALSDRAKSLETDSNQQRVKLAQLKAVEDDLKETLKKANEDLEAAKNKISSLESSVTFKTTELESLKKLSEAKNKTLEVLRMEKKTLSTRLDEEVKKVEALRSEVAELKKGKGAKVKDAVVDMLQKRKPETDALGGMALDGNHAEAAAQDGNNAAEEKQDGAIEPPALDVEKDEREQVMAAIP